MSFKLFHGDEYRVCAACAARALVNEGTAYTGGAHGWLFVNRAVGAHTEYLHFCTKCKRKAPKCLAARMALFGSAGRLA
jgi:hypothetical protein